MPTSPSEIGRATRALVHRCGPLVAACLSAAWVPPACHAQPADSGSERTGHLIAFSEPNGAHVYIDGLLLGRTPIRSVALTPGTYTIWFRSNPPLTFEPEPLPERTFTVAAGDSVLVHQDMGSIVRLETSPPGAHVTVAGRPIGRTPVVFRWHRQRTGDVRVLHEGFRARRVADEALAEGGTVRVRLAPFPGHRGAPGVPRVTRSSARINWRAWASLAASGTAAVLAVHFKSDADEAYDRYLSSALPSDQEGHLDDSNRLDRLAAVSWVVAEGSLLAALWFFARDVLALEDVPAPLVDTGPGQTRFGLRVRY